MAEAAVPLHHNNPPSDAEILRDRLAEEHRKMLQRADELLAAMERVPEQIDETTVGRASDFVKQLGAATKDLDRVRVSEKEPFLAGGRTVDGFFKVPIDKLDRAKRDVEQRIQRHLRAKEAEERRRREEAERLAREEAERARREAEVAAAKMQDDAGLETALAKEDAARIAKEEAAERERQAAAKAAELARTRSDYGSVATLRTNWTFEDLNRATLDLEMLRDHLPLDGLEKAVRSYIRAGGRELRGVRIVETTTAVIR